ncbi:MAG: TRAP transporter small permease subunit [Pseudomonadota bacterium]
MAGRIIRGLARSAALAGGGLLGLVVMLTVVNAAGFTLNWIARPFGGAVPGLPGYEDAVGLLSGVAVLAMLPHCQITRGHVVVDVFTTRLSAAATARLTRGADAVMGVLALFLAAMLARGMLGLRADGVVSPVLGWPVWPFLVPGIGAALLWAAAAFLTAADREQVDSQPESGG